MSLSSGKKGEVAKRYATVLFQLATQEKLLEVILKDVEKLSLSLKENSAEWKIVMSPVVHLSLQQKSVREVSKILKLSSLFENFLYLVCQNRKWGFLSLILEKFYQMYNKAKGKVEGVVEVATVITKAELNQLKKYLKEKIGKDVDLKQVLNKDLMGGINLKIGSLMIDLSLRAKLIQLQQMMKG